MLLAGLEDAHCFSILGLAGVIQVFTFEEYNLVSSSAVSSLL